ncbi:MAG: RNA methyltransferase [Candidatus Paceibacterota bacterium]|jgi:tRNA (guanosine-2'-O-)-methyltransferase
MGIEERTQRIEKIMNARQGGCIVVLEDISDPHNAGAVIRTAEAFGISDVWLVFNEGKSFNPRKVGDKSSSHANKWMRFKKYKSSKECIELLRKEGYEIVVTALTPNVESIYSANLKNNKIALFFGNEHSGLSLETIETADRRVCIPMRGMVQSLNISVTAGIVMYEVTRQRMENFDRYTISDAEVQELTKEFNYE